MLRQRCALSSLFISLPSVLHIRPPLLFPFLIFVPLLPSLFHEVPQSPTPHSDCSRKHRSHTVPHSILPSQPPLLYHIYTSSHLCRQYLHAQHCHIDGGIQQHRSLKKNQGHTGDQSRKQSQALCPPVPLPTLKVYMAVLLTKPLSLGQDESSLDSIHGEITAEPASVGGKKDRDNFIAWHWASLKSLPGPKQKTERSSPLHQPSEVLRKREAGMPCNALKHLFQIQIRIFIYAPRVQWYLGRWIPVI